MQPNSFLYKSIVGACFSMLCLLQSTQAQGISEFQKEYQLNIRQSASPIKVDGVLNEACWANSEVASNFKKKYPNDIGEAKRKTEVRFTFDDKNIYFACKVFDSGNYISTSLKRDAGHDGNDGIGIILDPLNQKSNGFFFVVSALNVQSEDQVSSNGNQPSWSWDTKWTSATKDYGDYWVAEMMIPFKSIRFDPKQKFWGINFLRMDAKNNEYSTWAKVPQNFRSYGLGYMGVLNWENAPPKNSKNIIFLPYITGNTTEDREQVTPTNGASLITKGSAGFDAKVALNSSLNVDLTVNPDFSQVEADQQVTNLTRFSIFLPEKRNFFIENSDLFSNFGIPPVRPFYSRSIGLNKAGEKIPILFGARLSGNLTPRIRIGAMDMQTGRQGDYSPENFSAITLQKRVFDQSVIRAYFLNRENYISAAEEKKNPLDRYGRNAGIDYNYTKPDGTAGAWISYHQSIKATINSLDSYVDAGFSSNKRNYAYVFEVGNIGKNFYTDMGYVERINNYDALKDTTIRVGYKNIYAQASYKTTPLKGQIGKFELTVEQYAVFNPNNSLNQADFSLSANADYKNTSILKLELSNTNLNLLYPTSITGATPLPAINYNYSQLQLVYYSDMRKPFGWNADMTYGQFYNGMVSGASVGIQWRNQPHLKLAMRAEFNNIVLPSPYGSTNLLLIAPRLEWNFNTQLFWSTFVQYNTQSNNFNINSRLQYRFKPMSDFFLVYTDNYFTDPLFKNKNRALVFKFSYWFNL